MNIPIHETLSEATYDTDTHLLSGVILRAGLSKNGNYYPADTIVNAADKFVGVKCFIDHSREGGIGERSIRDVCGVVESCRAESDCLRAMIRVSGEHDWIASMVNEGILGDVSINALGRTKLTRRDGRVVREVIEISKAYSVDFVTDAAAGGRVEALLRESAGYAEGLRLIESMTLAEFRESRPDLVERIIADTPPEDELAEEIPAEDEPSGNEFADEHTRLRLVESVITSRGLPGEVAEYLREQLCRVALVADGISDDELNKLVEDHLDYLGKLSDSGMIRSVSTDDPLTRGGVNAKASTFQFLGVGSAPGRNI